MGEFESLWDEVLSYNSNYRNDSIAKREYWHNYTDQLCKDGFISYEDFNNWDVPY